MGLPVERPNPSCFHPSPSSRREIVLNQAVCLECKQHVRVSNDQVQTCRCGNVTLSGGSELLGGFVRDLHQFQECSVFLYIPNIRV